MTATEEVAIWQVDAFADRPFSGNPAAVCILDEFRSDQQLQEIAAEMNLSETAFVVRSEDPHRFRLRWFTPTSEVKLCGHATLAAAHTLFEQRHVGIDRAIRFQTLSGELKCTGSEGQVTLDFPIAEALEHVDDEVANEVVNGLGIDCAKLYRNSFDILAVVDGADTVEQIRPNFGLLGRVDTRGVIVTARGNGDDADFVSRFFAPRYGIDEDPVTGSAHCCLAPYWGKELNKTSLLGFQASRRGGYVACELAGTRVKLTGRAVTILFGHLQLP
ncbi:MAG: PhzF family phenazine biosynthesis protein [Planctomycetota bacterium]